VPCVTAPPYAPGNIKHQWAVPSAQQLHLPACQKGRSRSDCQAQSRSGRCMWPAAMMSSNTDTHLQLINESAYKPRTTSVACMHECDEHGVAVLCSSRTRLQYCARTSLAKSAWLGQDAVPSDGTQSACIVQLTVPSDVTHVLPCSKAHQQVVPSVQQLRLVACLLGRSRSGSMAGRRCCHCKWPAISYRAKQQGRS
jgi:hypothetical protein